jgi:hypothetical protein
MADQPTPPRTGDRQLLTEGAIPRVGMSIPMPASTKPPAPSGQQSSSTTKPQAQN